MSSGAQTLKGDVNGDGIVDVADITEIVDIILHGDKKEEPDTPIITTGDAIDLGLSVKWASCNVGATSPEEYGGYYAWGETEEKSSNYLSDYLYYTNGSYTNIGSNISGTQYDVATTKWGSIWRMPTSEEQEELLNNCIWEWTTLNGINGYRVTGTNSNSIFLPAAGDRYGVMLNNQSSCGGYWSSSLNSNFSAHYLLFCGGYHYKYSDARYLGLSVRPVCE